MYSARKIGVVLVYLIVLVEVRMKFARPQHIWLKHAISDDEGQRLDYCSTPFGNVLTTVSQPITS